MHRLGSGSGITIVTLYIKIRNTIAREEVQGLRHISEHFWTLSNSRDPAAPHPQALAGLVSSVSPRTPEGS